MRNERNNASLKILSPRDVIQFLTPRKFLIPDCIFCVHSQNAFHIELYSYNAHYKSLAHPIVFSVFMFKMTSTSNCIPTMRTIITRTSNCIFCFYVQNTFHIELYSYNSLYNYLYIQLYFVFLSYNKF